MHLIIPYASPLSGGCRQALATLELPNLRQLLQRLAPQPLEATDEYTLTPPHERALAQALGIDGGDGLVPWAAWQMQQAGTDPGTHAWALLTPCWWQVGSEYISLLHPESLQLQDDESRALLEAMRPYFEEDGIELQYQAPLRWLARSELWRELPTASLDRVLGRNLSVWMPDSPQAAKLRRLNSEMQMLLYRHPVNEARSERGQALVNSFWVSGTGALPPNIPASAVRSLDALREPALADDAARWAAAWQQLDGTELAAAWAQLQAGQTLQLTLCGERRARSWTPAPKSLWQRLRSSWRRSEPKTELENL